MLQSIHRGQRIGYRLLLGSALLALIVSDSASAQTTIFTYQGKLNDNGNPANGPYDFQFKLFDTLPWSAPACSKAAPSVGRTCR